MDRREGEEENQFQMRKLQGQQMLDNIEMLMSQTENITISLQLTPDSESAEIKGVLRALPGTEMRKDLRTLFAKKDIYAPLFKEDAIFSLNLASQMNERDMKMGRNMLTIIKKYLSGKRG